MQGHVLAVLDAHKVNMDLYCIQSLQLPILSRIVKK